MKTRFYQGIFTASAIVALSASLSSAAVLQHRSNTTAGEFTASSSMPVPDVNIPEPDPNSPKWPVAHVNIPEPDPNSPKWPVAHVNIPEPDPNSPKWPVAHVNIPEPDPNSPKWPVLN